MSLALLANVVKVLWLDFLKALSFMSEVGL